MDSFVVFEKKILFGLKYNLESQKSYSVSIIVKKVNIIVKEKAFRLVSQH